MNNLTLREINDADAQLITRAFAAQGWDKPETQFQNYLASARAGRLVFLLAEFDNEFAGYVTILWYSPYPPFLEAHIPEIADFNVLKKYQRRGIGSAILDEAEKRIALVSSKAGIGVGLTPDYGTAQRMYARRGYVPDGRGIFHKGHWLEHGESLLLDDEVALYMTKELDKIPQT